MKLVVYSNYLNIHQVHVMDELHRILGDGFRFVATLPRNEKELKGGEDYSTRPYCILAAESENAYKMALDIAADAEVCIFGACSQEYAVDRAKMNPQGLSFEMGERWLKHGWMTIGSPVFRRWLMNYWRYYRKANFYKLCCGAFAANDDLRLHAYKNRHYKWGYFTKQVDRTEVYHDATNKGEISMMWCARFLDWKHPEFPVKLAGRLKAEGVTFHIDMFGTGVEMGKTLSLCRSEGVEDVVTMKGNLANDEILEDMRNHDIFLFTSDRGEGWGAVLNEAMGCGCAVVASDETGSAPFLIKDGVNGLLFKSGNLDSLYEKTLLLIRHLELLKKMAAEAALTMNDLWSPRKAAENLLSLIGSLQRGEETPIKEGPCSKA